MGGEGIKNPNIKQCLKPVDKKWGGGPSTGDS